MRALPSRKGLAYLLVISGHDAALGGALLGVRETAGTVRHPRSRRRHAACRYLAIVIDGEAAGPSPHGSVVIGLRSQERRGRGVGDSAVTLFPRRLFVGTGVITRDFGQLPVPP